MPLSDMDEFTGRTVDGVARDARFLDAIDAIKDAIWSRDRNREYAGFERSRQLWSEMTEKEREGVVRMMSARFMALSEAYACKAQHNYDDADFWRAVIEADHLRDLRSTLEHFRVSLAREQKSPAETQSMTWADVTIERLHDLHSARMREPKAPVETQATISAWAESTFGPSGSNARAIARANREMAELLEHVTADDRHPEAAEEIADIVIVLSRVMTRLGVDLQAEVDRKMAKNRARKWKLDGTGHGYHVKDAATSKSCRSCGNAGTHAESGREYCKTCGQEVL